MTEQTPSPVTTELPEPRKHNHWITLTHRTGPFTDAGAAFKWGNDRRHELFWTVLIMKRSGNYYVYHCAKPAKVN